MSNSDRPAPDESTIVGGVPVVILKKGPRPHVLRLVKGPEAPKDFTLEREELIIGRALEAHISIDSQAVSRRHAQFTLSEERWTCTDLDSANGVYVNGERTQSKQLADGDSVQIGDAVFIYKQGG
jgi:pSer/pThr/pTyr-binding forkhead associated (FHA) protein